MQMSDEEEFTVMMAFVLVVVVSIVDGAYALAIAGHWHSPEAAYAAISTPQ